MLSISGRRVQIGTDLSTCSEPGWHQPMQMEKDWEDHYWGTTTQPVRCQSGQLQQGRVTLQNRKFLRKFIPVYPQTSHQPLNPLKPLANSSHTPPPLNIPTNRPNLVLHYHLHLHLGHSHDNDSRQHNYGSRRISGYSYWSIRISFPTMPNQP